MQRLMGLLVLVLIFSVTAAAAYDHDSIKYGIAAGKSQGIMEAFKIIATNVGSLVPSLIDQYNEQVDAFNPTIEKHNTLMKSLFPDNYYDLLINTYDRL